MVKEYDKVQIIPMNKNENETRVEGALRNKVKADFFENALKETPIYYYHNKAIDLEQGKKVLALFQYDNRIIAYGIVHECIKAEEKEYIKPALNDKLLYNGLLKLEDGTIFTVDDITNEELNNVLEKKIRFSNVSHILEPKKEEFLELLRIKSN